MPKLIIQKTAWDLSPLLGGDDDPAAGEQQKIVERESYAFINKWSGRDDYLTDPAILKEALDEYERWLRFYGTDGNLGYYFWLRSECDEQNPALKAKFNKVQDFSNKIQNDIQFFTMRVSRIPETTQAKFLEYPELALYRHFLERLFVEAKYLLSEPEEKILNLKAAPASANWIKMTSGFLSKEEREVVDESGVRAKKNFSRILSLMDSQRKNVRDEAARVFNDILYKYVEVGEAELNSVLGDKKINDELRGFSRPDASRHISDDISTSAVDALIESVAGKFEIAQKYYTLKAKLMGVEALEYHERNVPFGQIEKTYSFQAAAELTHGVFQKLDPQFAEIFSRFLVQGQIDVYPETGKRSGAFCAHGLLTHPTYVFLNYTDKLRDVSTLAHEMGHAINNELMRPRQSALNFGTPLSTAEVASTFMEDFIIEEIMSNADDEERLTLMMMKLGDDVSTIFRQVACYNFEADLHRVFREKGYLSKDEIGSLFQKNMQAYTGPSIRQSPGSENWWLYWSHVRSFFYVYSYASGLLISKSLQNAVKRDPAFIKEVKGFLSAGLSDSPHNIFLKLGVDIDDRVFWAKGLEEIKDLLGETTALAEKLGKI